MDEYFEENGRKDKLGGKGGDRFYVNKGDIEFVDDGTGAAAAHDRAKRMKMTTVGGGGSKSENFGDFSPEDASLAGNQRAAGLKWSEHEMATLTKGVQRHGRKWMTIKRDREFAPTLRAFSNAAMKARSISTLVPIRPCSRGARRSLRTLLPGVSLRPTTPRFQRPTL